MGHFVGPPVVRSPFHSNPINHDILVAWTTCTHCKPLLRAVPYLPAAVPRQCRGSATAVPRHGFDTRPLYTTAAVKEGGGRKGRVSMGGRWRLALEEVRGGEPHGGTCGQGSQQRLAGRWGRGSARGSCQRAEEGECRGRQMGTEVRHRRLGGNGSCGGSVVYWLLMGWGRGWRKRR